MNREWLKNLKVGDKVYIFDVNHREYDEDRNCIYSKHFIEKEIESETSQSWVLKFGMKVKKKTGEYARGGYSNTDGIIHNQQEMDDMCWMHDNRYKIICDIEHSYDIEMFKEIYDVIVKFKK